MATDRAASTGARFGTNSGSRFMGRDEGECRVEVV
jgi:hypothetical protein